MFKSIQKMRRIVGQSIERNGLFKKEVKDIYEDDTPLVKEIKGIEKSFISRKGEHSSSWYSITSPVITNILLWRLNKKIDTILESSGVKK